MGMWNSLWGLGVLGKKVGLMEVEWLFWVKGFEEIW